MDKLKRYLQQQNTEMDVDTPRDFVLQNVLKQSAKKQTNKGLFIKYAAAAAVLAILILSVKWMMNSASTSVDPAPLAELKIHKQARQDSAVNTIETTNLNSGDKPDQLKKHPVNDQSSDAYQMIKALGRNYAEVVKLQLNSIRNTPLYAENPEYFDGFKTELGKMDALEIALRKSIKKNGPGDVQLEQLINVYQRKLDLLKSLRMEIGKMNERVKQFEISVDSSKTYYLDI